MKSSGDPIGGSALPIIDASTRPRRVIFIGVDAGRYDYLERFKVPNIERLIKRGVSHRNAVCGSFMSETAPGFASLSTGVYAKTHGICTSRDWFDKETKKLEYFYDEQTGKFRIEAPSLGEIWKRVRPDVKVAAISTKDRPSLLMAGPEADTIVYAYNEKTTMRALGNPYQGRGVHKDYFTWTERLGRQAPSYLADIRIPRRIDWVAEGVNRPDQEVADTPFIDGHIMDAALKMMDAEQPDLFFVTLVCVNMVAHLYGTNSPEIRAAVEYTDLQIGRLLDRLEERGWLEDTLIVVASDHGMTDRPHQLDVLKHLESSPDVEANIAYYLSGACGGIYLHDNSIAACERAIDVIRKIPNIRHAWRRDDPSAPWFVRRFAHRRCPDILIMADRLFQLVEKGWNKPSVPAHHGPPYLSDVNVWSIYSGAGVKRMGRTGEPLDLMSEVLLDEEREAAYPKQVDVHPTIRAICGF